ncbi:MAG: hypothetical protein ACRDZR_14895 [Acidimicrobiales bacterium]
MVPASVLLVLAGTVLGVVPVSPGPSAGASVPPAPAGEAGSTAGDVCSMLHHLEPYDNRDLLTGMYEWLDGGDVPWEKIGTFALLTFVSHAACTAHEDQVARHLRKLLPHPGALPASLFNGPGGIVAPVVLTTAAWTPLGPGQYRVPLQLDWFTTGNTVESDVDVALVVVGEGPLPYQHFAVGNGLPGTPGSLSFNDTLSVGTSYQEAVRVDDNAGTSTWTCSEPFHVAFDPGPVLQFQPEPAVVIAASCSG